MHSPQTKPKVSYDVIVIGGGAAGMFCAFTAGQRGRRVALLESNDRVGKKIGISGGGRCNFTNIYATADNYLSTNPDFCKSALARYTPWDFISLVEMHGIRYHEKTLGQQFCNGSSREIIEMLSRECLESGVQTHCSCKVLNVEKQDRFVLQTSLGEMHCDSLVIATGGLSFAKLGATDFGHRVARQFGLKVTELRPGLVPLTFTEQDRSFFKELPGIALPVLAKSKKKAFPEALLFTHRGVSGPAILQISSYWQRPEILHFDLLPERQSVEEVFPDRNSKAGLVTELGCYWPRRFAESWCARHAPSKPLHHYKTRELEDIVRLIHDWPLSFSGTEGYPKAEVTLGGVDTGELSSKTMESRKVPGLFFIGEVIDVTGWLGGYNFQWAWASGNAAGLAV